MSALDRIFQFTLGKCRNSVTKLNLSRHKFRRNGGILYCPKCPKFSAKSKNDMKYLIPKKHFAAAPKMNHTCKECTDEFPGFYSVGHHKQRFHIGEIPSGGEKADI